MFVKRLVVAIVLVPTGVLLIYVGGVIFTAFVGVILALAAWEFSHLFKVTGLRPASFLVVGGSLTLFIGRAIDGFESAPLLITLLFLICMIYHLVQFERGLPHSGTDFSITLGGAIYIGWLGAYFVSLRQLPDGMWWLLLVLPAVWLADSGAYSIGRAFGKRPLSQRLSPKKTWEGYFGGILFGTLGGALLAWLWSFALEPGSGMSPWAGAVLGLVLAVLTPLGDLGESMFKRQAGVKDSSNLIPGHGGALDRIDSWLWAAPIGYYIIFYFIL
ncbi:MAG: phosphatidate cytidylyltransferase [Anaerolineales bacterium]|nr:phosphatidate cytidylyltransferase [Anaerolineales bacterium]